eukprot:GFKZ01011630.1.p1 GENE.GFKZ01011630.1~~GFKZ01011630.1.p1  ORF type:complete len:172 (-),score=12.71 GFKZ01011630.1:223-738(-)
MSTAMWRSACLPRRVQSSAYQRWKHSTACAYPPAPSCTPRPKRSSASAPSTPPSEVSDALNETAPHATQQSSGSSPTAAKRHRAGRNTAPAIDSLMVQTAPPPPSAALPPSVASSVIQRGVPTAMEDVPGAPSYDAAQASPPPPANPPNCLPHGVFGRWPVHAISSHPIAP